MFDGPLDGSINGVDLSIEVVYIIQIRVLKELFSSSYIIDSACSSVYDGLD